MVHENSRRGSSSTVHTQTTQHTAAHTSTGDAAPPAATDDGSDIYARKAIMFTGPDGLRIHRSQVVPDMMFVGNGVQTKERTSDLSYLFKPAEGVPFPLAKNGRIGETGWEAETFKLKKGL